MSQSRDELNEAQLSIIVSPAIKSVRISDDSLSVSGKLEVQSFLRQLEIKPENNIIIKRKKQKIGGVEILNDISFEQQNITPNQNAIQINDKKIRMSHFKGLYLASLGRKNNQIECPICFNLFDQLLEQEKTLVEVQPCSHIICKECVLEWAEKYKSNCPVCRAKIVNLWSLIETDQKNAMKRDEQPLAIQQSLDRWDRDQDDFYFEPDPNDPSENICMKCQLSENLYLMIICDKCNSKVCHTYCDPALEGPQVPDDKWYCLNCRKSLKQYNKKKPELHKRRNQSCSINFNISRKPIYLASFFLRIQNQLSSNYRRRRQYQQIDKKWKRFQC